MLWAARMCVLCICIRFIEEVPVVMLPTSSMPEKFKIWSSLPFELCCFD